MIQTEIKIEPTHLITCAFLSDNKNTIIPSLQDINFNNRNDVLRYFMSNTEKNELIARKTYDITKREVNCDPLSYKILNKRPLNTIKKISL